MSNVREREDDNQDLERSPKRVKVFEIHGDDVVMQDAEETIPQAEAGPSETNAQSDDSSGNLLPPSHALLGLPLPECSPDGTLQKIMETDVGISEYVGHDVPTIGGIIKQRYASMPSDNGECSDGIYRFTDFLVYEVDQDSNVIHLKDIGMPSSQRKKT